MGTRRVISKVCGARIGVQVVFYGNLATLGIVVADQAISWLVVLFQPVYGGVPIFYLGAFVIKGNIVQSDQKQRNCEFFFSSRRRHTRFDCDWSSDVCSSD